jgi:hypothetical protein
MRNRKVILDWTRLLLNGFSLCIADFSPVNFSSGRRGEPIQDGVF